MVITKTMTGHPKIIPEISSLFFEIHPPSFVHSRHFPFPDSLSPRFRLRHARLSQSTKRLARPPPEFLIIRQPFNQHRLSTTFFHYPTIPQSTINFTNFTNQQSIIIKMGVPTTCCRKNGDEQGCVWYVFSDLLKFYN